MFGICYYGMSACQQLPKKWMNFRDIQNALTWYSEQAVRWQKLFVKIEVFLFSKHFNYYTASLSITIEDIQAIPVLFYKTLQIIQKYKKYDGVRL